MPSRSTLTASSVYFLSVFSFSHLVIAETNDIDTQIREAAVAQLNQNKAQALDKALTEAENEAVDNTPTAQQQQLQKILKLAIAKATNEHDYDLEKNTQKLIEQMAEDNSAAPVTAMTARQAAMNEELENATASALSTAQTISGKEDKTQAAPAVKSAVASQVTKPVGEETTASKSSVTEQTAEASEEKNRPKQAAKTEVKETPTKAVEALSQATDDETNRETNQKTNPKTNVSVKTEPTEPSPESSPKPSKPAPVVSEKPEKTIAQAAPQPPQKPEQQANKQVPKQAPKQAIQLKTEQWMYIGQFKDGSWTEKTIAIGDTLPKAGQQYAVSQSVNVRAGLPNKENMPAVITSLGSNAKITLVELKASGNQGYYWGKIER